MNQTRTEIVSKLFPELLSEELVEVCSILDLIDENSQRHLIENILCAVDMRRVCGKIEICPATKRPQIECGCPGCR